MSETPFVPLYCFFKGSYNPTYEAEIRICQDKCHRYNLLSPSDTEQRQEILRSLLGKMGHDVTFVPPFWCDYGSHIQVGDHFYANHNLVVQDGANITCGDHVFIGPNCVLTTAEHALDPTLRREGVEIAKPIRIGSNVWLGANVTVLAGVTIGDDSVIGAGSVVTKDIPPRVVAVGVPCRVLREISEADRTAYPFYQPQSARDPAALEQIQDKDV